MYLNTKASCSLNISKSVQKLMRNTMEPSVMIYPAQVNNPRFVCTNKKNKTDKPALKNKHNKYIANEYVLK